MYVRFRRIDGSSTAVAGIAEGAAILRGRSRITVCHLSRGEYARFGRPFHTGPWIGRTLFRPAADVGFLYVRYSYSLNLEAASPRQAVVGSKIPVLLIHGLNDRNIPPLPFGPHPGKKPVGDRSLEGARRHAHTSAPSRAARIRTESVAMVRGALVARPANEWLGNLNFTSPHSQYCPVSSARPRSRAQV
jgi:hypothetical protein